MTRTALIGAAIAALAAMPALAQQGGGGPNAGPITRAQMQQMTQQRFAQMDANHDGFVTPDEMTAAGGDAQRAAAMLQRLDTNHDGKISLDEMTANQMRRFDAADANHDGVLTPEERQAATARMQQQAPQAPQAPQGH
jgi:Ca2+-binding EF-hand superfamily protein